ncbi:MAG: hypothetical protein ACXVCN_16070 [Bdellovibrio sp.]
MAFFSRVTDHLPEKGKRNIVTENSGITINKFQMFNSISDIPRRETGPGT